MEIVFRSRKMQKLCSSEREMRAQLGERCARVLQQRLAEIQAAETLDDLGKIPAARCHQLSGDRKGQLAVDLVHPRRLVFEPGHNPIPTKPDGGLDWKRVTRVIVVEVVDYH